MLAINLDIGDVVLENGGDVYLFLSLERLMKEMEVLLAVVMRRWPNGWLVFLEDEAAVDCVCFAADARGGRRFGGMKSTSTI